MYNIENKKLAVSLILIAVFGIVLCIFLRQDIYKPIIETTIVEANITVPADYKFIKYLPQQKEYSPIRALYQYNSNYVIDGVNIMGLEFMYKNLVSSLIILIGVSIYLFLYKTDDEIKSGLVKLRMRLVLKKKDNMKAKFYVLFVLITIIIIALILLGAHYYSFLQSLKRPLTWAEAIFIGFSKVFLIVTVIAIVIGIINLYQPQNNNQ